MTPHERAESAAREGYEASHASRPHYTGSHILRPPFEHMAKWERVQWVPENLLKDWNYAEAKP